jgi:predicted transporter
MTFRSLVAAAAALTMTTSTALAADVSRAAAPVSDANFMGGDSTLLLILAVILIGAGIFVLADNEDDTPTSP